MLGLKRGSMPAFDSKESPRNHGVSRQADFASWHAMAWHGMACAVHVVSSAAA